MERKSTEVRKEEIKQAVLKIIGKEGIKSVSTKNLAKYTGLSEGAIFRHFKSKKDIITSIIDDVGTDLIGALKAIAHSDIEPAERLFRFLCHTIKYLKENNGITILLFTEASHTNDSEMMDKLNHIFNSQQELVSTIIKAGIDKGIWNEHIPIEIVTRLYMGIPITFNINLVLSKSKSKPKNFCKEMTSLFERILLDK